MAAVFKKSLPLDQDIATWISNARNAPRLSGLLSEFSALATGAKGTPDFPVTLDYSLLSHDKLAIEFSKVRDKHAGVFNQHFVASLPYVLEEQCRFGAALFEYSKHLNMSESRPSYIYTLGDGPGVMARTLSDISDGKINTLTCSPNIENQVIFEKLKPNNSAHFFLGPFFEVTSDNLASRGIKNFEEGFDVIIEDTTFQMYGKDRTIPIHIALRNLRKDGIFVMLEKFTTPDPSEFIRRETQKDTLFKSRFFHKEKIKEKQETIVNHMNQQLVSLEDMKTTLEKFFSFSVIIWNSGNFYTIASSNDKNKLTRFIECLIPPAIPSDFCYTALPQILLGDSGFSPNFRALAN